MSSSSIPLADRRWQRVLRLAGRQHGLVDARRLLAAGDPPITRRHVERWVAAGRLEKVAPRVWRIAGNPITWEQHLHAGLLCLGATACVSHEAAAQLHGFDRTPPDRVEFLVPRGRRSVLVDGMVHSTTTLGLRDRVNRRGLRVTSATRTILDLASTRVPPRRLEAAIDSAVRSGASAPVAIQRRLAEIRGPGRWGCRAVDAALVHAGGHTMLERLFLELMDEVGAPRPSTQRIVRDGTRHVARVDFCFESLRVVVEVSGRLGHSTPAERARDAQRRNELQDLGFRVYEYTWDDVTRRPEYVKRTMAERLDGPACEPATT